MDHELHKKVYIDPGSAGRPSWYPTPPDDEDLLFFIQRNQNTDTIVYRVRRNLDGLINNDIPMEAYWIRYTEGGTRTELNEIQNRLAYGYESKVIAPNIFSFQFVSYQELTLYIVKSPSTDSFKVIYQNEENNIILDNIYVYADEMGVFPVVKYIELFGQNQQTFEPHYQKISISDD